MVLAAATIIALPIIGGALAHHPDNRRAAQRGHAANLQLGMAGAFAMAMVIVLYGLAMDGVTGLGGADAAGGRRAAAAR